VAQLDPYYFDYAASAPPYPEALAVQAATAAAHCANPSAQHAAAAAAREQFQAARAVFYRLCNFADGRLIATSGATEANNLVLASQLAAARPGSIAMMPDLHASLWFGAATAPASVRALPPPPDGVASVGWLAAQLDDAVELVCMGHVCSETGRITDVAALTALCARREVRTLVDGTQALGHVPVDLTAIPCDYYTFSAHKFGGPRGVGGLFCRGPVRAQLQGGGQEYGLRAGTENVAGLVAAAAALEQAIASVAEETTRLRTLQAALETELRRRLPTCVINSGPAGVPGLVSCSIPGQTGGELVAALAMAGFAVGTGSACHADEQQPSRALLALGHAEDLALGTLRISMGRGSTAAAVTALAAAIADSVQPGS
jgi:cysteine desulfurase